MKKAPSSTSPNAYLPRLAAGSGSARRRCAAKFHEEIKWGGLVFLSDGPSVLIHEDGERVLFAFWRGQRLREIEPRLKAGGKYEMATMEIREDTPVDADIAVCLAKKAAALNKSLVNSWDAAKPETKPARGAANKPNRRSPADAA